MSSSSLPFFNPDSYPQNSSLANCRPVMSNGISLRHPTNSLSKAANRTAYQSSNQCTKYLLMPSENAEPLAISLMPMEILIMIAWNLPPSSRALFALTCKRFWKGTTRRISCEETDDSTECLGLGIPRELPPNFQGSTMSDPQLFQPERWELLRLLERDISDTWLLCFDCFKLHPRHVFGKPKTPLVPWLKSCGGLFDYQSPPRSCRYLSRVMPKQEASSFSLSGVVDLCPCVRLTPAKRNRVCAARNAITQNGPRGKNNRFGHSCLQFYDDMELKIILTPFFYEQDGGLGFSFQYRLKRPIDSSSVCPRMVCPHISLDTLIKTSSQCRGLHSESVVCAKCKGFQRCPECHTTVFDFFKDTEFIKGNVLYIINSERPLDEKIWNKHIVFPFARQRQYESMRTRPSWKLW